MKWLKKILFFFSLFLVYLIFKELVQLYVVCYALHPWAGYGVLAVIVGVLFYFVLIPVFQIVTMPQNLGPTKNRSKTTHHIENRFRGFKGNRFLKKSGVDLDVLPRDEEGYREVMRVLQPEAEAIRKKYVTQLFYSTAIVQNGFLDAVLILSASVNLVKDLFVLYHGRVSNKDLWTIAKKIYISMAIGGSEGVEYATDEILSKLTAGGIKSIPFASRILGSVADGFVNAALLTRVSLITENYCRLIYISSDRELSPSIKTVIETTRLITSDLMEKIVSELKNMTKDKTGEVLHYTVNPVGVVIGKAVSKIAETRETLSGHQKEMLKETSVIVNNPLGYGIRKVTDMFKKQRTLDYPE